MRVQRERAALGKTGTKKIQLSILHAMVSVFLGHEKFFGEVRLMG